VIDLDNPRWADRDALTVYTIRNLLEASRPSPYRNTPTPRVRLVADAVATAADPSFLVARITATTLAAADTTPDPTDPQWRASLPRQAGDAMRTDLNTRLGPDARRARDLLRPLAYAEGQGLPWEDIWAPLASRISGNPYTATTTCTGSAHTPAPTSWKPPKPAAPRTGSTTRPSRNTSAPTPQQPA
jgi:hypothetical protein